LVNSVRIVLGQFDRMRQFLTIAINAFMELVRQSIYLILMSVSAAFIAFLASIYYFGFGDDAKLVKDSALAVMLLAGLFGAVLSAAASVAHEIRSGTALAVLAKPVGRIQFLLAKYAGVAAALTLLTFVNLLTTLLASRMAFDVYGSTDKLALGILYGAMALAYILGGFSNFFLRRPFVSDAVFSLVGMITLAFVVINCFNKDGEWQKFASGIDWRLVPASILILFALWILAGLAIACSTRYELIPTLSICSGIFLLGLMSDYIFRRAAEAGSWWGSALYAVVPNWQLFWMADALENKNSIPWSYVGKSFAYVVGYLGAVLAMALFMFEDRELT
jgi:ABC-type transport system involved in multi-copper enzyme maturation permease subunit